MAIGDRTYQWAAHTAWGYPFNFLSNVIEHTFGYTYHKKKVSAGTTTAVLGSTAGAATAQSITAGISQPDVPRVLSITIGGSGMSAGNITINGINVEGKLISDAVAFTTTGLVTGKLVFKRVTSVSIPAALSSTGTLTIGTTNEIGLNHRCPPNFSTVVVIHDTTTGNNGSSAKPIVEAAPSSSNFDGQFVEKNWVQAASTPNGTWSQYFFYWFHKVLVYPPKDSPEFYSTTTSTSTSSTSSSTSSTSSSSSTSQTTFSTSSTSSSTSSTSTSTTTLPV